MKKKFSNNFGEGAHARRRRYKDGEPLNDCICSSAVSDRVDWDRWEAAKKALTRLRGRTAAGQANRAAIVEKYRVAHKEKMQLHALGRDGPSFDTKQCKSCSKHIPCNSVICPECGNVLTKDGAKYPVSAIQGTSSDCRSVGSVAAVEALWSAQVSIEPKRNFVVHEVHECRGRKPNREFLVEWASYPAKGEWTWEPVATVSKTSALARFLKRTQ